MRAKDLFEATENAIAKRDAVLRKMDRKHLLKAAGEDLLSRATRDILVLQALYKKFPRADVDRYLKKFGDRS